MVRRVRRIPASWLAYVVIALIFVLGLIGFHRFFSGQAPPKDAAGNLRIWTNALYVTIGLFTLRTGFFPQFVAVQIPWQLEVARWLAAALAGVAIWKAAAQIFHRRLLDRRLRRLSGHTLVCGLGRKGFELVRALKGKGTTVVAIEQDPGNVNIPHCDDLGISVVTGDARDERLLAKAGADRARRLIFVCGNDATTVQAVVRAREHYLSQEHDRGLDLSYYAEIFEPPFAELLNRHPALKQSDGSFNLSIFNVYENTARRLLADHPLEVGCVAGPEQRTQSTIHVVIIGFGAMGQSIATQAARIGHFAEGTGLKITVIDPCSDQRRLEFFARQPQFEQVCTVAFETRGVEHPDVRQALRESIVDRSELVKIFVCEENDQESLMTVLRMTAAVEELKDSVYLQQHSEYGFAQMLSHGQSTNAQPWLVPFGMPEEAVDLEEVLHERLDRIARAFHESHVQARLAEGAKLADDIALAPWSQLSETFRSSNRQQADHLDVKLRAIGCCRAMKESRGNAPAVVSFADDEVELLARMEHARWRAERLLAGWKYGEPKDKLRKISSDLVAWDMLPPSSKEYNRHAVREIPQILALVGEKVERRDCNLQPSGSVQ